MSPENKPSSTNLEPTVDLEEYESDSEYKWFAGALEVGGVIAFGIQRRKSGHVTAYPLIAFRDSKKEFVDVLKNKYKGSVTRPTENSWEWRLNGYGAADIISQLGDYVANRREMYLAVRNWLEAESTTERVDIAISMKGYDRWSDANAKDYERRLKMRRLWPEFLTIEQLYTPYPQLL